MAYPSVDDLSVIDGMLQVVVDACDDVHDTPPHQDNMHPAHGHQHVTKTLRDTMHCVAAARALADAGASQASIAAVARAAQDHDQALLLIRSALGHAVRAGLRDGQWRALAGALDDAVVHGMRGDDALRCGFV